MRRLLSKIADRKKAEKAKAQQLETHLKRLSFCLSVLLVIQFALNVGQTSVYGGVNKHVVGVLSVLASVNTFAIALLGKLALGTRNALEAASQNQRRWDKAEDTFTIELSSSLADDGRLSPDELQKLHGIYTDVSDFVDGSSDLLTKNFSPKVKATTTTTTTNHGSGTDYSQDSRLV